MTTIRQLAERLQTVFKRGDVEACQEAATLLLSIADADEKMPVVGYGAYKREGAYRACHDFQALLHDVPLGATVEPLVRQSDAIAAIAAVTAERDALLRDR